ncbi:MAG: rane protein [Adhaeribacter sp.]|jgi:uncharacterized membrane protein|nr:rane protein [Adhaeribacter sp.]
MSQTKSNPEHPAKAPRMAQTVERNIKALLKREREADKAKNLETRVADSVTRFAGSMAFVYIHFLLFAAWIIINLGWVGLKPFDPSFVVLAMFASVEAIFLSTFVLISQNRMSAQAGKRADLDLQVSLLSEHEVTRLITLVSAIAKKMNIDEAHDPEIEELARDVRPEKVLDTMEKHEEISKEQQ